jgi:GntR family transcriptional regulator of vanillate catabolism
MSPPSRQQLRAVLRLRELVLSGEFRAGERIPELTAVAKLGMSRTPVRIALSVLEHEGLLESSAGGGYIVRDFSLADVVDAIELRGVLEGTAARFAAERHSGPASLKLLAQAVRDIDALLAGDLGDAAKVEGYVELNEVFHARLTELAASGMLRRALAQAVALPFASPNAFLSVQSELSRSSEIVFGQEQHRALLEAIGAREGARAEALAREHARLARRKLSAVLERRELLESVPGAALIHEQIVVRPQLQPRARQGTIDAA